MTTIKCLGSGSRQGNCYLLSTETETLILDCGIGIRDIKIGLDFDIKRVAGVCVTHHHGDHSESVKDFRRMGIQTFTPYENPIKESYARRFGSFKVTACPMLDKYMQIWQHTNSKDGTECPCYAFLIEIDGLKIVYVTDTKLCTWRFAKMKPTHFILGCDYMDEMLSADEAKRAHVLRGHLSLNSCIDFVNENQTEALQGIYLGHISEDNNDKHICVKRIQEAAGSGVYVDYAAAGKEWILRKKGECPF